jgi:hypothetical protein
MMVQELANFLPAVKPGSKWGDKDSNVDYAKSWFQTDDSRLLFLNDVDSSRYQPQANYPTLPNVFFAGDFCKNCVKMSTVEGAVVSGLEAAQALQKVVEGSSDIAIAPEPEHSETELLTMRLALLPAAYGASAWSAINIGLQRLADGEAAGALLAPAVTLSLIPFRYAIHWWQTVGALGTKALSPSERSGPSALHHGLRLCAHGLLAAGNHLYKIGAESGETGKPLPSLVSVAKGLLDAVDERLREVHYSPQSVAVTDRGGTIAALRSAVEEGSGLLRGSGRFGPSPGYRPIDPKKS